MITHFGIQNFLSYSNQKPFELGRLNVFVGKNSSGKSTILHALALLSETLADPSPHTSLLFSGNGLNLGTYPDVVHQNDRKASIAFDITFAADDDFRYWEKRVHRSLIPNRFRLTFREDARSLRPYVSAVSAYAPKGRCFTLQGSITGTAPGYIPAGISEYARRPATLVPQFRHFLPEFRATQAARSPKGREKRYPYMAVTEAGWGLENLLRQLVYIGPSRSALDAIYFPSGRNPVKLDSTGGNAVPLILGSIRRKRERDHFERTLEHWLGREFNLVSGSAVRFLEGGHGVRLEGIDPLIGATVALSNTGFGVSQVLPIVIQLAVGNPCVLLIEQPEIHLHPEAQAQLANLLLHLAGQGYQLLVETHSEHLIFRLRALLARGESPIPSRAVKIFHVEKEKTGSRVRPVSISRTGKLDGWPEGFFSASSNDILDLLGAEL